MALVVPDTSLEAFLKTLPNMNNNIQRIEAVLLRVYPRGLTCEEIQQWTGMKHQTASSTITHMYEEGKVWSNCRERKTIGGFMQRVHIAATTRAERREGKRQYRQLSLRRQAKMLSNTFARCGMPKFAAKIDRKWAIIVARGLV